MSSIKVSLNALGTGRPFSSLASLDRNRGTVMIIKGQVIDSWNILHRRKKELSVFPDRREESRCATLALLSDHCQVHNQR